MPGNQVLDNQVSYLKNVYNTVVVPKLKQEFGYANDLQIPKVLKVSLSVGVSPKLAKGDSDKNNSVFSNVVTDVRMISGQNPMICKAKTSIAGFNLREGMSVGVTVTLRGEKMYNFLEKLIYYALPRVKDFKGFSPKGFDGHGNYSFGLPDRHVFLEANNHLLDKPGISVVIVTSTPNDEHAMHMLHNLGIPFNYGGKNG